MYNINIKEVKARQVLDSRGNPTVEADVILENGLKASAIVPSGASTGIYEANEKRDNNKSVYLGKGVKNAVKNVNTIINDNIKGLNVLKQREIDQLLISLDGTKNKEKLGANAILAVSLAVLKCGAKVLHLPLYKYIGGVNANCLPVPMMNIINGGLHANNNLDIQEFMITPVGAKNFEEALRYGTEIFHTLGGILKEKGLLTGVGDEGGYAPNLESDEAALQLIVSAIEKAGYKPYEDVCIALDAAASGWWQDGKYVTWSDNKTKTADDLIDFYCSLVDKYPIISIEDPLNEDDYDGFTKMLSKLGGKCQIIGDDLYATNKDRLSVGIEKKASNSILIKLNQIGTVTETLEVIEMAKCAGLTTVISHRSGETEDTTIADLAVAVNSGLIKTGAPSRTDRVCKYNQLLRIEEELGSTATFKGIKSYNI